MGAGESARHWRHPQLPGVDLLRARYLTKTFARHTHDAYVIGAIAEGVEVFRHRGAEHRAGPGGLALINPGVPHSAHAGGPEGWRYDVLYTDPGLVAGIAAETASVRGTPGFATAVADDPGSAGLVARVHRAAEEGQVLAADSLLRIAVARLLRLHGGPLPSRPLTTAGARTAERARAVLEERMADPPTLEGLADQLSTGVFALLRAYRERYGMPPHAWLTDARVHRARSLLEAGVPLADTAAAVGFTDQSHLSRHFGRIVGVPPGAYQRERLRPG
ncbi:AraC family transcriptional regulator [Streptomyces abyssalis]|uniref:AraC family transcriptional regulator n=1 Tax=Streptomyces abyssalis TaxID=933944 RepID=A0A1E7JHK8_9ACTN|nr:AraC family transcriptional regulator [Streptomyces abyssalis]OEU85974.1 AraC family transcriptional regulator [Streptomyces abyssalis]OEU92557.1 AraC family transcriptional regulator [Streptomyces abyssalis]OEV28913.1 AraC family transcriptional regulator [Streptomyces nanshensis]